MSFQQLVKVSVLLVSAVASSQPVGQVYRVQSDGGGEFRSISEALVQIPAESDSMRIILISPGRYHEKLFVTQSNVALVGADRATTVLTESILRSSWVAAHDGDDWGAGVVNIADNVHDVIFANMSIENTYGDSTGNHDHQFAIRGFNATRISLLYCTVRSAGGDAVSLWDRENGMYYHAYCRFEGWVDYVCPRGWCYITNSQFYGHNIPSASIWHDGSARKDQKFVIRQSSFDGDAGFPLGRHHRDAQFYLLDCTFSRHMADRPIGAAKSPNTVPWKWGGRYYYWNCTRTGGNFEWFGNNLNQADGSPDESVVDANWTFHGTWNPDSSLPDVLPFPSLPTPRSGAYRCSPTGITLRWHAARSATKQLVSFGPVDEPRRVTEVDESSWNTGPLIPGTMYVWQVLNVVGRDTVQSDAWTFHTAAGQ